MDKIALLKRKLKPLAGDRRIIAVMLFGSWARGEQKKLSDIDICIIPARGVGLETLMGISPDVDADVSYFYNLPLHMRHRVLAEGKPLLVNDEREFAEAKSRAVLEWLDFKPVRERLLRAMVARGVF